MESVFTQVKNCRIIFIRFVFRVSKWHISSANLIKAKWMFSWILEKNKKIKITAKFDIHERMQIIQPSKKRIVLSIDITICTKWNENNININDKLFESLCFIMKRYHISSSFYRKKNKKFCFIFIHLHHS